MINEAGYGDRALSPSTGKAEAGESLSSQPDWSTDCVSGQPGA